MASDLINKIIEEEQQRRPKFLAHAIVGKRKINIRADLAMYACFKEGKEVKYSPVDIGESEEEDYFVPDAAMSLWPWRYQTTFWTPGGLQGAILFDDRFYDKICSPKITTEDLIEAFKITLASSTLNKMFGLNHSTLIELGINPIPVENAIKSISKYVERYNGVSLNSFRKEKFECLLDRIGFGLEGIIALRYGDPRRTGINIHSDARNYLKEGNILAACAINRGPQDFDTGIRAFRLNPDGNLESLSFGREDVRYLFSFDFEKGKEEILMSP
ncbi:hypothetical protein HYV88_03590 [Candidatus Woesearchaeota archaeon]|nr:hypothetical protein [Candidatus Woesearchaeota archaeon]